MVGIIDSKISRTEICSHVKICLTGQANLAYSSVTMSVGTQDAERMIADMQDRISFHETEIVKLRSAISGLREVYGSLAAPNTGRSTARGDAKSRSKTVEPTVGEAILAVLSSEDLETQKIAQRVVSMRQKPTAENSIGPTLSRLRKTGHVTKRNGKWGLSDS